MTLNKSDNHHMILSLRIQIKNKLKKKLIKHIFKKSLQFCKKNLTYRKSVLDSLLSFKWPLFQLQYVHK